jgi:tRNA G10  N-methylase Trm11
MTTTTKPKHPARYSDALLPLFDARLEDGWRVLDPFAGTGRIHELRPRVETYGVEIEPEWSALSPFTLCGDATALPFPDASFDAIVTSPTYGNRFADSHTARDGSTRRSYTHDLRAATGDPSRRLHERNTGAMRFGEAYCALHEEAWREACRVLRPGGRFVLNVKDHVARGKRVRVSAWHAITLRKTGLVEHDRIEVPLRGMGFGANGSARIPYEYVIEFVK